MSLVLTVEHHSECGKNGNLAVERHLLSQKDDIRDLRLKCKRRKELIITALDTYNSQDIAEIIGSKHSWQSALRSKFTGTYFHSLQTA